MAIVRPEYGPTLGELAAPRWRALSRGARLALAAVAAVVVVAIAALALGGGNGGLQDFVRSKPFPFSFGHAAALHVVAPHPGEVARLETSTDRPDHQLFIVRGLTLPPYRGDVSAALLAATSPMLQDMRAQDPNFVYRGEGRVRVNNLPGYQLVFTTKRNGTTVYGKRVLLVGTDPGARKGVDLVLLADRSPAVPNVASVGNNGLLKAPLRSFRLSTDRTA
jgi:hypothetical protein